MIFSKTIDGNSVTLKMTFHYHVVNNELHVSNNYDIINLGEEVITRW